jgi:hypothetical protein
MKRCIHDKILARLAKAEIFGGTGSQGPGCRSKSGMTSKNQEFQKLFSFNSYPVSSIAFRFYPASVF